MEAIVKHLKKGDMALKTLCANALFKVCHAIIFFLTKNRKKSNHFLKRSEKL